MTDPSAIKPLSFEAKSPEELRQLFERGRAGEFRVIALQYGHGRPGKPFAKIGVIWPEEKQAALF